MAYDKIAGRMPLWFLLYIVSAGVLVVLTFPFNLFSRNSENMAPVPLSADVFERISRVFDQNFRPFAMVNYLADFPNGLIGVLLLSLVFGTFIYLLYDAYKSINHFTKRMFVSVVPVSVNKILLPLVRKILQVIRRNKVVFFSVTKILQVLQRGKRYLQHLRARKKPLRQPADRLKVENVTDWLVKTNQSGYLDFLGSMHMLTVGSLYGAETFFLMNLARVVNWLLRFLFGLSVTSLFDAFSWLFWSAVMVALLYGIYTVYFGTFKETIKNLVLSYKQDRPYELTYSDCS